MLLRDRLMPKIEPPKNLKAPTEIPELPICEKNKPEDLRLYKIFVILGIVLVSIVFFLPADEISESHTVNFADTLQNENYTFYQNISNIRSDIKSLKVFLRFNNRGFDGQRECDLFIHVYRDGNLEDTLNGSYYSIEIKPKEDRQIFEDVHPAYEKISLKISVPKNYFTMTSSATITVKMANPKVLYATLAFRYINIAYLVFVLLYFIKNMGFKCPEHYITFVLICVCIIYNGPLSIYRIFRPNRIYILLSLALDNAFGAVLLFSTLSIFTLIRPWNPEILEGNVVISWVFFVVTTFFKVLPAVLKMYGELTMDNAEGIPTIQLVGVILGGVFSLSLFSTQKKEYRNVPENFKYRFWVCTYMAGGLAVLYAIVTVFSNFLPLLSPSKTEFMWLGMATMAVSMFASIFFFRKLAPFNFFHSEDDKYKLE